jgi:hypothetical protein
VTKKQCTKLLLKRKVCQASLGCNHKGMNVGVDRTARVVTWQAHMNPKLVTVVIIEEVISDCVVELNPTTVI